VNLGLRNDDTKRKEDEHWLEQKNGSTAMKVGNLGLSWQYGPVAYGIIDFSLLDRSLIDATIFLSLCTSYLSTPSSDRTCTLRCNPG
jgi:hypothetical protein